MKKTILLSCVAALFASLSLSQAQQATIAQWNFEALTQTNNPDPAANVDNAATVPSATALGMQLFGGGTTNFADVTVGATSDTGSNGNTNYTQIWRIRGNTGNGWTSTAGIGTQGAQFNVDTTGFTNMTVAFDWYPTTQGEGHLQLQYTDDGINWTNIAITVPAGELGKFLYVSNNTTGSDPSSVQGYYIGTTNGQDWFTNLSATITDPQTANNPNFGIRMVNASTGTSCVNTKATALNNSSGNWRFDNVNIVGQSIYIAAWNFENLPQAVNLNPAPSLDYSLGSVSAASIGMQLFGGGTTNAPDVTAGSTGDNGTDGITNYTQLWRIRGKSGNGWISTASIGTQGAQLNVDTTGYTNIAVAFDWYLTAQGEGNLQFEYTDDGINWSNLPITVPAAQLGTYISVVNNTADTDPNSVKGYFVSSILSTDGQMWYTNLQVEIADPLAANNPLFSIRMVNASTGASCVNSTGQALNNSSGNWRFDNIYISGVVSGTTTLLPPAITASLTATVDGPFTNTFPDNANWRANISKIVIGGVTLASSAYVISPGQIVYTPSQSVLLQKSGSLNISVSATGYSIDTLVQAIASGTATHLAITQQPVAPTGNGGTLVEQPYLAVSDQYNNPASGTATYTATPSTGWSFGTGSAPAQMLANGVCQFTNLSAISGTAVSGATITFTASGISGLNRLPYTTTNSAGFNIPAPAVSGFMPGNIVVEQLDANLANTTFSMLELNPNIANQAAPVNTFPVPATGTNALRNSNSGSTGRLANSGDGTLICFTAGQWGDATLSDATTVDPRGCGTFNSFGQYNMPATYVGLGDATANQARSATTLDDVTFWMGDKGGVYTNNNTPADAYIGYTTGNSANVRSLKAYNGMVFALQQEGGTDPFSTVMAVVPPPADNAQFLSELAGFPIDGSVLDFSAVASGANGTNIDVIYYIDGTNNTSGAIFKYTNSFTFNGAGQQVWGNAGVTVMGSTNWPTANGGDGLAARTNASGGFDLFYTTGNASETGNQVVMVHDSGAWDEPINLTATNVLYTAPAGSILKGVAFAPVTVRNGIVIYPIGALDQLSYAFSGAHKGLTFSFNSGTGASGSFTIWSATNLMTPPNLWKDLGNPVETPPGTYSFTDPAGATNSATFYRVTSP